MKTIEIKQKLVEEALDQLKAAQQDSYVQSTQNVIDELELALRQPLVMVRSEQLPSLDNATKVAVRISEEAIIPPLDAKEQAMFIAGFQECIKWLNVAEPNLK